MAGFCTNCGAPLNDQAKYCTFCGAEVKYNPADSGKGNKKKPVKPVAVIAAAIAFVVALAAVAAFVYPGFLRKDNAEDVQINRTEVVLAYPTAPEAITGMTASFALESYTLARMYLEKLLEYDISGITIDNGYDEYSELLRRTADAFEDARKISNALTETADMWMQTDDHRQQAVYNVISDADNSSSKSKASGSVPYVESDSEKWAKEIVDASDKTKVAERVRLLADHIETDSKHAFAQLMLARVVISGADQDNIAASAELCRNLAEDLQNGDSAVGFVISASPVAVGTDTLRTAGEAAASSGGVIMSGVNAASETAADGAALYFGTEGGFVFQICGNMPENAAENDVIFSLTAAESDPNSIVTNAYEMLNYAETQDDLKELMNPLSSGSGKNASELYGVLALNSAGLKIAYGTVMLVKTENTADGLKIIIEDTKAGTSPARQAAMKEVLQDAGLSETEAQTAVDNAVDNIRKGILSYAVMPVDTIPADMADSFIGEHDVFAGDESYDINDYTGRLREIMNEFAAPEE